MKRHIVTTLPYAHLTLLISFSQIVFHCTDNEWVCRLGSAYNLSTSVCFFCVCVHCICKFTSTGEIQGAGMHSKPELDCVCALPQDEEESELSSSAAALSAAGECFHCLELQEERVEMTTITVVVTEPDHEVDAVSLDMFCRW